jgi:hypothetical protein
MSHILNEMTDVTRCAVSAASAVRFPAVDFRVAHGFFDDFDGSNMTDCEPSLSVICWLVYHSAFSTASIFARTSSTVKRCIIFGALEDSFGSSSGISVLLRWI